MNIKQIQCLLAYLGYYNIGVDGSWGPGSKKACTEFQEDYNKVSGKPPILVDGIPGGQTEKALTVAVYNGWFKPKRQSKPDQKPMDDDEAAFWASVPNFEPVEFECHCGCGLNNADRRLIRLCQKVRNHFDAAFNISSPCRCKANNDRLPNAAKNSRHLYGRAVDFGITGHSDAEVLAYVDSLPEVAFCYIMPSGNVHMDIV